MKELVARRPAGQSGPAGRPRPARRGWWGGVPRLLTAGGGGDRAVQEGQAAG